MSIPQYYGATGYLMVKHADHLKVVDQLKAENEAIKAEIAHARDEIDGLRKGWYSDDGDNIRFWPEEMDVLRSDNEELLKAITDIGGAIEREYWSEYAGLDETRAILDAALGRGAKS